MIYKKNYLSAVMVKITFHLFEAGIAYAISSFKSIKTSNIYEK